VGITLVALLVALIVVETATKRYDAAAHLGINPISNFDNAPVAADGALFQQPADGSSVTVRATEVLSSPRYLDTWKRSSSYTALGPHRDNATISLSPLSQADIIAVQASAPEARLASAAANHFARYVKARRDLEFQTWLKGRIGTIRGQMQLVPTQFSGLPEQPAQSVSRRQDPNSARMEMRQGRPAQRVRAACRWI
jgi:hypothetical protein